MELTYMKVGDYYIPDLALDDDAKHEIGIYGRMRQQYLEEHHHGIYTSLLLTGNLWKHLADIDAACHERMDFLFPVINRRVVALVMWPLSLLCLSYRMGGNYFKNQSCKNCTANLLSSKFFKRK